MSVRKYQQAAIDSLSKSNTITVSAEKGLGKTKMSDKEAVLDYTLKAEAAGIKPFAFYWQNRTHKFIASPSNKTVCHLCAVSKKDHNKKGTPEEKARLDAIDKEFKVGKYKKVAKSKPVQKLPVGTRVHYKRNPEYIGTIRGYILKDDDNKNVVLAKVKWDTIDKRDATFRHPGIPMQHHVGRTGGYTLAELVTVAELSK